MTLNPQAAAEAPQAPVAPKASTAPDAPGAPVVLPALPRDGGRFTITDDGDNKTVTIQQVPPQLMPLARMAQETALGLMGLLAAIFILGPFARMIARRMERRPELRAAEQHDHLIQQQMHQLEQLQQSVDAMSVEVERISESQRFQSKLMLEKNRELTS
ncbi:MAG: hypothetical protein ABIT20_13545 [Gemmatimonadaceae bacterium]